MHITVIGATGGTGRQLVTQALDRGHKVVAVARRPDAIGIKHSALLTAAGDVYDVASLEKAITGTETVIFAAGIASIMQARKGTTIYSQGIRNLLHAMKATSVRRLIAISSGGLDPKPGDPWWFTTLVKPLFLAKMYADMRQMEQAIVESSTTWTIVRPPQLIDGPWTGIYRTACNASIPDDKDLSRGDLAHFILNEIEAQQFINTKVEIAY